MEWYNKYEGYKHADAGRSLDLGIDCWGLICEVFRIELGINLPLFNEDENQHQYIDTTMFKNSEEQFTLENDIWLEVPKNLGKPFDIWSIPTGNLYGHVALFTMPNYMLHIQKGSNVTHERTDSIRWKSRMDRAILYRHKALA